MRTPFYNKENLDAMVKRYTLVCVMWLCAFQLTATSFIIDIPIAEESKRAISKKLKANTLNNLLRKPDYLFSENRYETFLKSKNITSKFSWDHMKKWDPVSNSIAKDRDKAAGSFKAIENKGSWVDSFTNEDIQELPVGVKHIRENIEYAIGITKATFTKDYTELTVFARVKLPQSNSSGYPIELFFGANNVKLSHQGGIIGDANLVLLGDLHIPFNAGKWMLTLKGGFNYKTGKVKNLTYVTINCSGVKELGIQGEVEFSRDLILPVESNGEVKESKLMVNKTIRTESGTQKIKIPHRVRGGFNVVATDWNDLLVGIDLQPFVLAKKRNGKNYDGNFQFEVNKAVLDFSDLRNDPAVDFPEYYRENGLLLPNKLTWRGVYVNTVEVRLPKEFKTSETINQGNKRVAFGAHHLIIDNYGVSGTFYGDNIFPLDKGRTNDRKAWAYSLDHIEVSLAANNFIGAGFEGQILLPVSKKKKSTNSSPDKVGLRYKGLITSEEYLLKVSNTSVINFNLWKAKGKLLPNSSIELAVRDGQFRPKATLHGNLEIRANQNNNEQPTEATENDKKLVEFKGIEFKNLVLQTETPVFKVGSMGYKGEVKLANFPVSISDIGITSNDNEANLYFDLAINLMGEDNGFAAKTSLAILGKFEEENYQQKWKFQGIDLDAIAINANMGGFTISGALEILEHDPKYGNGFKAEVGITLKNMDLPISAKGVFAKKGHRFWYVDFLSPMNAPFIPPMNIIALGGGISYGMRIDSYKGMEVSEQSFTGIIYEPSKDIGISFKAVTLLGVTGNQSIKGKASLGMEFNSNGGLNYIGLYGYAEVIAKAKLQLKIELDIAALLSEFLDIELKNPLNGKLIDAQFSKTLLEKEVTLGGIKADLSIDYDFQNSVLHGTSNVYIDVLSGVLEGRGLDGRAGWTVFHFAPDEWYIYIGTPEDRLGLRIGVGPISVESGGYFMTGSVLPGSPPPPPQVASILGLEVDTLNYMRDENALKSGSGFAFGADIAIDTGDLNFLIFYARLQAGAGFDIMLRDYGEAKCSNTGDQVGINGWYANGQAYAYLQGEIGINIKLFFVRKKIPIISGGAAVLLQAKAPNPIWMRGYVGGHFNVLGGLVKGKFRFKLTIGEECVFEDASPLGGLKIITDVTPDDGVNDIDVFAIPQATFSMKVGEPLIIPEDDGDKTYKIILEKYRVLHNGQEITGVLEWSPFKDRANFVSDDILPPNEQLTVQVEVSFKEKINGIFQTVKVDGQAAKELEERTFTTGGAPDYIPLHNISYAYPVIDQKYFLENEHNKGYIQLKRGQDYLFDDQSWESFIKYTETSNSTSTIVDFNYNTSDNVLNYGLPNVAQSSHYHMAIASRPKGSAPSSSVETNTNDSKEDGGGYDHNIESTEVEIQQKEAENLSKEGEIERLAYDFGTSEYKTFKKKINSLNTKNYNWGVIYSDVIYLTNRVKDHEPFDLFELIGSKYTDNIPLVSVEATLDDNYFTLDMNPPLYSKYPLGGQYAFENREVQILGTPPKHALPLLSSYLNNLEYEVNEKSLRTTFPFRYNLGLIFKEDWVDMQSQIVNDHVDGRIANGNPVLNFLDEDYLFMRYGFYKTTLSYKLPGGKDGTSTTYKFKNPNNFRN